MARFKKNALNQITFPLVDRTDFATIESAVTSSDFDSQATKRGFGYNHGGSAATTSFAISKLTSLVRSGILRQVLKATECNYDRVHYTFRGHASCADQHIILDFEDNDDSDLMSAITVGNSRLLINKSVISDLYSQLSDFRSATGTATQFASRVWSNAIGARVDSRVLKVLSDTSDIKSAIAAGFPTTVSGSDISDIASAVRAILVSDISDILSGVRLNSSRLLVAQSFLSDIRSNVSDLQSDFQSRVPKLVATNSQLSDLASDIKSAVAVGGGTVTVSNISDIASAVFAAFDTTRSQLSDVYSLLSAAVSATDTTSNVASVVMGLINTNGVPLNASAMSDLRSAITAAGVTLTASDISDIASAVVAALPITSQISDIYSLLSNMNSQAVDTTSLISDIVSQIKASGVPLDASTISDLRSAIAAGPAATVTASDISDIASAVRAIIVSDLSDILSGVRLNSSRALVAQSFLSDIRSHVSDLQSDFQSRVPKLVATNSQLSDLASDIKSAVGNITVTLSQSNISDIASAVVAGAFFGPSEISDIVSAIQVLLGSDLSDILSGVRLNSSRALVAQSFLSDIRSHVSDFQSDFQSRVPKRVATDSQLSDVSSDLRSLMGVGVQLNASSLSDIRSAIAAIPGGGGGTSITASDISDIVSAVLAAAVEGTVTVKEVLRLIGAMSGAKTDGFVPGQTGTGHIRDLADTKNRMTVNYDPDGNITGVVRDLT